ncbi:TolC family protein, partial [Vibrio alginolyticus]|uniref:TolC family protein n=1 Tax=Vibrio alginolyticus TaxID=663 RepID=UPI001A9068EC
VSLPFGNRAAKADFGRVLAQERKIQSQFEQARQIIESEVRNAVQSLKSAEARLSAAAVARIAAEQLYDSEIRQFRAGTTT